MPRRLALSLIAAGLLAVPSAANAASATFFPGESVDSGPGTSSPRVDLAPDGTGAVVYVKQDDGVEHVFASRLDGGRWQAPERLDPGLTGPASQPVVAAGDGGQLVVAFVSGGQLYTVVRPAHARSWPAPIPGPPGAASPSIDLSTNGVAYVVWTAAGNVQATRLERGATSFTGIAQPLDVNPADEAGGLPGEQPKVVVAADGVALVVFGEAGHVFARHLFELRVSTAPQQLDVATLGDLQGVGGDSADVATEADSSYAWAVFRQRLSDGTTRTLARRLRGSLFDPPVDFSGTADSTGAPRVALNATGVGIAAASGASSHGVFFDSIANDQFVPPATAWQSSTIPSQARVDVAAGGTAVLTWMVADAGGAQVLGAWLQDSQTLTRGRIDDLALGPVDPAGGFDASMDKNGDAVVAFVQGSGAAARISCAVLDRAPRAFTVATSSHYRNSVRPKLAWGTAIDSWGPITYTVTLDGKVLGRTTGRSVTPRAALSAGDHRLVVAATDQRGQTVSTHPTTVRIDTVAPRVALHAEGLRQEGQALTLTVDATDPREPLAAGIAHVTIDPGDGSGAVEATKLVHVFRRGTFTVTARVSDRAGNVTRVEREVTIKMAPPKPKPTKRRPAAPATGQDAA